MMALCITIIAADVIGSPKLMPKPPSQEESALTKEGKSLHDQGKYDEAINKYQEVLKQNPDNVLAIYEMAFSYFIKKDYNKALEIGLKGAQYKSDSLIDYYILIGNTYDLIGQTEKAIEVYEKGIKLDPQKVGLHYNLAVTFFKQNKIDKAKKSLKTVIIVEPNHSSSHFALSQVYKQSGYKIPSLLSAMRFLVGETKSSRSDIAIKLIKEILLSGVKEGENNQINIFLNPEEKKDEGDFESVSAVIALTSASRFLKENKNKTELENYVDQIEVLFSVLEETDKKQKNKGFAAQYYIPYFSQLKAKGYSKAFAYYILQSINKEASEKWLSENKVLVDEFFAWSRSYSWPKPKI